MAIDNPCMDCGACCAFFRVSFYWAEATDGGGRVPVELTTKVNNYLSCMNGTETKPARCVSLKGEIGKQVYCDIYEDRSSTCREFKYSWEDGEHQIDCDRARAAYGLPPLKGPFELPVEPPQDDKPPRVA